MSRSDDNSVKVECFDQLRQLYFGPVWDGDLISKSDCTKLAEGGYACRTTGGNNMITSSGVDHLRIMAIQYVSELESRLWGLQESVDSAVKWSHPKV